MFNIYPNSLYMMAVVICLLITSTLIILFVQKKHPENNYHELRQRIRSWWVMISILFAVLVISKTVAIIFFAILSFIALKEFFSIVPTRQIDRSVVFLAYLSIPVQYYWVAINWYGMFIIFIPVYVCLALPLRMVLIGETKGFIRSAGILHWATMLSVFFLSHTAFLLVLPEKNELAGYIGTVLFLVCMTQFNDICQYIWGKILGKHKIIPKVSPNKTWEGFLGGLITTTCVASITAPLLTPLTTTQGVFAGALIGIGGFIGDVVISSIKRDLQIKDSSTLIPGHGGILDRLDSLIYTAPLFFHFLYYLHY